MDLKAINNRITAVALIAIMTVSILFAFSTGEAMAFSGKVGSTYTVENGGKIVYGPGDGGYSNSKITDLKDGLGTRYSYCVQPNKPSPSATRVTVDRVVTDDADTGKWNAMRNIIYYSPSYPGYEDNVKNIRGNYYTGDFEKDWGIAHLALSYVYAGRPEDMATYGNTKASDLGEIWTKAKKLGNALWKDGTSRDDAVPDNFKVFICFMEGVQDMLVGYLEAPGTLGLKKSSTLDSITKNNGCYSLKGAEYTVYDQDGKVSGTLTADEKGVSNILELPAGKYTVKESKAPKGYALDTEEYTVKVESEEETFVASSEVPITAKIDVLLVKRSGDSTLIGPEGDASLKGAVYRFEYFDMLDITEGNKPKAVWYFVTDEKGRISGESPEFAKGYESSKLYKDGKGSVVFPLGRYVISEVKAPEGYMLNEKELVLKVKEDGTDKAYTKDFNTAESREEIIRGGVELFKVDRETGKPAPQGGAELKDAEFTIYNMSQGPVTCEGRAIEKGSEVITIKTDENGKAATAKDALPYGTYLVKETKAPEGYLLDESWEETFEIRENGSMVSLDLNKAEEAVMRAGIRILKRDKELMKSEAQGGATLEGIKITIKNLSNHEILVRSDLEDRSVNVDWNDPDKLTELLSQGVIRTAGPGEDAGIIKVYRDDEKGEYIAETLSYDLPYGTYSLRESSANASYERTDRTEHIIKIDENGVMYSFDNEKYMDALIFDDNVYRSDLQGIKIRDKDSARLAFVPFKITCLDTGEAHVTVTDRNGYFSTKDRRTMSELEESEETCKDNLINPFDDLLEKEIIMSGELEERYQDIRRGVWFGQGEAGSMAEPSKGKGALPYGKYRLEELPCENNRGLVLQSIDFSVDEKSLSGLIELGTVTDETKEEPGPDEPDKEKPEEKPEDKPKEGKPKEDKHVTEQKKPDAPAEKPQVIKAEQKPIKKSVPKTGDSTDITLWFSILFAAGLGVTVSFKQCVRHDK